MPTPDFILKLREKIGHDLLMLPGLVAVVLDAQNRVLLNHRTDLDRWSLISGILEPGEQPEAALAREVREETGVEIRVSRLLAAWTSPLITYPNGDRAQYLTVAYRCEAVAGTPRACDDESLDVRFFARDGLPPLRDDLVRCIDLALHPDAPASIRRT